MFERHRSRVAQRGDDLVTLGENPLNHESASESGRTENRYWGHSRYHFSTDGRRSSSKVHASRGWLCNHQ